MKYRVYEDEVIEAATPTQLVSTLRNTSFVKVSSNAAFRLRAAFWSWHTRGARVRVSTDDAFVEDMVNLGTYEVLT